MVSTISHLHAVLPLSSSDGGIYVIPASFWEELDNADTSTDAQSYWCHENKVLSHVKERSINGGICYGNFRTVPIFKQTRKLVNNRSYPLQSAEGMSRFPSAPPGWAVDRLVIAKRSLLGDQMKMCGELTKDQWNRKGKRQKRKMREIGLRRKTAARHICGKILEEISQVGGRQRERWSVRLECAEKQKILST